MKICRVPNRARFSSLSHIPGEGLRGTVVTCALAACVSILPCLSYADDVTYGYDAAGRLVTATVAGNTAYYDYDAAGNITAIRRQAALSTTRADDALPVASSLAAPR